MLNAPQNSEAEDISESSAWRMIDWLRVSARVARAHGHATHR
jgi:hypothetical protein